ncbi:carbamoyl-phosphate synthase large subunit [Spirochaeta cellobiosiphila]|uniref:carbamoyl-phosphate synthase large subunit n=1 Tax=Spirochaeta cellobiosiphila TaxID=504483 RepID=UPI0004071041|nr:carbamoyl-phosphate synthase large subunit [Spirochaeta cellobiosiphila]
MPARKDINKILIIGSGPIVIGQACEFDYSGSQAVKALKEEGYEVVLVNPNPATMMTTPGIAHTIYTEPLTVQHVTEIIKKERPDAVLSTMGGQTALNLTLDLAKAGVLEEYNVEVIGANIESIRVAEDRGEFKKIAESIGLESPKSVLTKDWAGAEELMKEVGLPLVIRPSFTLGGMGGAIAYTEEELRDIVERALAESPVHEALVEESLIGWKEFEMEVMRDKADNAIIVCSIENIDPMGVHTGDSITIAPIQTLSDREYQKMRTASIDVLRAVGVDCGGSNVQFAVKPGTDRMVVIEMNPRVSRSSALASKATGFPIAKASARLAVGYTLDEVINEITGKTVSCFEPALDYCAVKVPRFEMEKFPMGYSKLGTQMKSVGESLALGRTAIEALNKAIRAAEFGYEGLEPIKKKTPEEIPAILEMAHPLRIFALYATLEKEGVDTIPQLSQISGYDPWFLYIMSEQIEFEKILRAGKKDKDTILKAKTMGLSDKRIADLLKLTPEEVSDLRDKLDIHSVFHFVDTCAGEFEAETPFFYSTYGEVDEGGSSEEKTIIILASGPNRIGQGLEFDTCCTLSSLAYRKMGYKTIIINSNPETVSTDFNVSDRLYIEPLTPEHVKEIMRKEKVKKVLVQLGGQTPLNMAEDLEAWGADIIGTPVSAINDAEDRGLFSDLLKKLDLRQPENRMAASPEEVVKYSKEIGFPVLLRPSFVLGGKSMFIAFNEEELEVFLSKGIEMSVKRPVLVDQFLEDAFEYDLDALSDGTNVYIGGIMQHIEAAGVHSGDSACVFPPYKSKPEVLEEMRQATAKIAREIGVKGFLNIQFAVKDDVLYILEVNPRASRTVPFLSKASGVNLIEVAVRLWLGEDLRAQGLVKDNQIGEGHCLTGWAVKEAVFSFDRFSGVDPLLGPEMKSTGEVIGTGDTFGEAFAKAQAAAGTILPTEGRVFVSVHPSDRATILPFVKDLVDLGFKIRATRGTAQYLFEQGIFTEVVLKNYEGHPNVVDHLKTGRIDLVINTPMGRFSQQDDGYLRIETVRRKVPYTTTTSAAKAAVEGIKYLKKKETIVRPLPAKYGEIDF